MHGLSTFLLSALPLALASQSHQASHRRQASRMVQTRGKTYTLIDKHQGSSFFDGWNFFTGEDPTHGNSNYLSQTDATSKGLAFVQPDNVTVIAVDDKTQLPVGGQRNTVRISSKKTYSNGLFIADFWSMPHGCGAWPSWWSAGPEWPNGGEIDIIEGVNNQATNQYTLHSGSTAGTCTLDRDSNSPTNKMFTSNVMGTQCESGDGHNAGCAFSDPDTRSFGKGFNSNGGGVFAHIWDNNGIKMWRFNRNEIPLDVIAGNPDPSKWPTPQASWSASTCDMASHFYEHTLTLNTAICGDWASGAFGSTGCKGTCAEAVANPKNFKYAKWRVNYISIYQ